MDYWFSDKMTQTHGIWISTNRHVLLVYVKMRSQMALVYTPHVDPLNIGHCKIQIDFKTRSLFKKTENASLKVDHHLKQIPLGSNSKVWSVLGSNL